MPGVLKRFLFYVIVWVAAYNIYNFIVTPALMGFDKYLPAPMHASLLFNGMVGTVVGVFMGLIFGLADLFIGRIVNRNLPFGVIVLTRSAAYCVSIVIILLIGTGFSYLLMTDKVHTTYLDLLSRYVSIFSFSILICAVLGFIMQVEQHVGPGNLLALFTGKYHRPKTEMRFFMFLDMRTSTTIAEKIGHVLFSELIQDCFYDLNALAVRKAHYAGKYGITPEFKAGLNFGTVTVTEVGNIKREIAFYGDVVNTAARIQSVCGQYGRDLLVSGQALEALALSGSRRTELVDELAFPGRWSGIIDAFLRPV